MTAWCAVVFAFQILIVGRVMARHPHPLQLGAGQILVATLLLCAAAAVRHDLASLRGFTREVAFAAALTGLLATAVAFVVQMWAQQIVPARHAAVCFATEPLCAALFATALYGESMPIRGWVGAAAILAAILLISMEIRAESKAPLVEEKPRVC
jgi:drug/metabolite transporter (DMT)-like permease